MVPYIVLAVGLLILLHQLGIQPTLTAVLAGHIVISVPYSVLVILPRLRLLDVSITEAARDLGASDLQAFRLITLPLLAPALVSSFIVAFTISFDEFAIASFLAPAGSPTFPVFVYTGARTPALQPEVIAVGASWWRCRWCSWWWPRSSAACGRAGWRESAGRPRRQSQ